MRYATNHHSEVISHKEFGLKSSSSMRRKLIDARTRKLFAANTALISLVSPALLRTKLGVSLLNIISDFISLGCFLASREGEESSKRKHSLASPGNFKEGCTSVLDINQFFKPIQKEMNEIEIDRRGLRLGKYFCAKDGAPIDDSA